MSIMVGYRDSKYSDNYEATFGKKEEEPETLKCSCCGQEFKLEEGHVYKDLCPECNEEMQ